MSKILLVDDDPALLAYLRAILEVNAYRVETASSGSEAISLVARGLAPDLVVLDWMMPGLDGLQTLQHLLAIRPTLKIIMLSSATEPNKVVSAMRLGAHDYIPKSCAEEELLSAIENSLHPSTHIADTPAICEEVGDGQVLVAAGQKMFAIRAQATQIAKINVPVLILGESGVGKEVVARLIHQLSPRAHRTFLKINCAALPADLLESELFGYEAGAFTGALRAKPGKFELCNHGTILLDEIGEMPPALQAKLLHVLQDQQFSRLGGRSVVSVDVRIMAATNINVQQAIATKRLREDLYYRLNAFTLQIPPLRERREEIPWLLQHFMTKMAERFQKPALPFSQALIEACIQYHWPGNLRELENVVKRYLILGDAEQINAELRSHTRAAAPSTALGRHRGAPSDLKAMVRGLKDEAEAEVIARTLRETNWNRKEAARLLNISYKALLYKIRQYNLAPDENEHALRSAA